VEVVLSEPIDSLGVVYRKERLQAAYEFLRGVPEDRIDLAEWCVRDTECFTIACGLGWLAMHPYFQALGLRIERDAGGGLYPAAEIEDPVVGTIVEERYRAALHIFVIDPETSTESVVLNLFMYTSVEAPPTWDAEFRKYGARTDKDILLSRLGYAIDFHSC